MAQYRVIFWKHIPTMVMATEGDEKARVSMPPRFQVAVDAYAMAEGSSDESSYAAGWRKGEWAEREGSAQEVAEGVASELEVEHAKIKMPGKT